MPVEQVANDVVILTWICSSTVVGQAHHLPFTKDPIQLWTRMNIALGTSELAAATYVNTDTPW